MNRRTALASGGVFLMAGRAMAGQTSLPASPDPKAAATALSFGSWPSPISARMLSEKSIRVDEPMIEGNAIYWLEGRPQENGRTVLVRRTEDGAMEDMTPEGLNTRTRVHEFGGGAYCLLGDGRAVFANFNDQRLYLREADGATRPLTEEGALRYADAVHDAERHRLIAVREDHGPKQPVNLLVAIDLASGRQTVLAEGHDFFASPRLSPDNRRLAWLSWDFPNMPWDGSELRVAEITTDGTLRDVRLVAGGNEESIFQPEWSPQGELHFVSDRSGWWNLYHLRSGKTKPLARKDAEFGLPQWTFGMSTYGFEPAGGIVCSYMQNGNWHLARLDGKNGKLKEIPTSYRQIDHLRIGNGFAVFLGGSPAEPSGLIRLDLATGKSEILRQNSETIVPADCISEPLSIEFPTEGGLTAFAYYYPPRNGKLAGPVGSKPPLLVLCHGGPTSATSVDFNLGIQYFTSRGFAVVDVNYGGSSGYGRVYRERLKGKWGIVDVDDTVNAARFIIAKGLANESMVAIRGGSAGGYTTLSALTFRSVFKAGASYYGIGDLETLAKDTHKFESRYMDLLIGPYPAAKDIYYQRSPVHFVDRLSCPMILFQGLDDKVVPPNQAQEMFEAVKAKHLPVALMTFEHEGHGFRRAETITRSREAELYFYGKVFGLTPADPIEPVVIENL